MPEIDIGEVARLSGLPPSTLRYYEEMGLIASRGRRGLRRLFPAEVLERLALIRLGRLAGFSLQEMVHINGPDLDRQRLADKADELDRSIERLRVIRDGLRHAAACPAASHQECPTFRRILRRMGKLK